MVISGGAHLEWPVEYYDPYLEETMKENKEFDEAMWDQDLEQGPPQDDDVVWLKDKACLLCGKAGEAHAAGNYKEKNRLLDIFFNEL